jgi:transglutaminase-like putative cysteine protease
MSADPAPGVVSPAVTNASAATWSSRRLAWLNGALAALCFEVAAGNGERSFGYIVALVAGQAALVVALTLAIRWFESNTGAVLRPLLVILSVALGLFLGEFAVRTSTDSPLPLEMLLLAGFRSLIVAFSLYAHRLEYQKVGCILSTFLVIFSAAATSALWVQAVVVGFAVVGIWWLMGGYWDSLRDRLAGTSTRELPRRWWLLTPAVLLLGFLALPAAGMQTRALWGFMPSSGGTEQAGSSAYGGVGDGEDLVAGTENIRSFAAIEQSPFLSSHDPSLYDVFDDSYDEPVFVKNQDRAIALPKELLAKQPEQKTATAAKSSKEFSTVRRSGKNKNRAMEDTKSDALFYVRGRTPLHLRMEAYDLFDGVAWHPESEPVNTERLRIDTLSGRPWLRLPIGPNLEVFATPESHALKIVRMETNRIPSPSQLLGVHIDQLNSAEMFKWAQTDVLRMDRKTLPAQTVLHLQSRARDPRRLVKNSMLGPGGRENYRQFGDDPESQRVRELAREWTKDAGAGWLAVDRIVERLRTEYTLDPDARTTVGAGHTAADFLFKTKRGPDYQFASAAACLLRSLGFSVRVVSGFYVDPKRYEPRGRHTAVLPRDVHFWVEVGAAPHTWIPIDPTPGYEVLGPPRTLWERVYAAVVRAGLFVSTNWAACSLAGIVLAVVVWNRRRIVDRTAEFAWSIRPCASDRMLVQRTVRLLDARMARAGLPRPSGLTPSRWMKNNLESQIKETSEREELNRFARIADWACFSPESSCPPVSQPGAAARQIVRRWPMSRVVQVRSARDSAAKARLQQSKTFAS